MNRRASSTVGTATMASTGVDGDHDGDQEAEIEFGEVGLQGLAIQFQLGQPHRGIAQLDRRP